MTTTPGIHRDDVSSSTAEEGKRVAGVAAEEAQNVASEAKDQVRRLVDETRVQANDQLTNQRDRLVDTLRTFGDDLEQMASQSSSSGLAADLTRQAAEQARAISGTLDGREPGDLLQDLRSFARRRPGLFLLGALTAGVVAGRLARGATSSPESEPGTEANGMGYPPVQPATQKQPSETEFVDPQGFGTPAGASLTGEPAPYQDAVR